MLRTSKLIVDFQSIDVPALENDIRDLLVMLNGSREDYGDYEAEVGISC